MITVVLIFSLILLIFTTFAVFRRRLFLYPKSETENLPAPKAVSLFAPTDEELERFEQEEREKLLAERLAEIKQNLLARANNSDFSVLIEARDLKISEIYQEILDLLIERNKLEPSKIENLAAFVSQNNLPANETLAQSVLKNWKNSPSTKFLPIVLHVSALANSANQYLNAVKAIDEYWQQKRLENVSASKLVALLESHYQLLPIETRTSGAGFLLKEKLASVREGVLGK